MPDFMAMDRRALLQRAMLLVGASVAASACQTMDALTLVPAGSSEGLSASQLAVLTAMSGAIIPQTDTPGAVEAGVPGRLNGMLVTWASPQTRADFARVLADIDALPGRGRSFAEVSPQEQHDLLDAHDAVAMQPSDQLGSSFISISSRRLPVDPAYGRLKDLIVTLYYMSEEAMTQELVYTHVPGRWDPSIPVTPETRPWGEPSLF